MKKAVIILPTYNEKKNIVPLVPEIFKNLKKINGWDITVLVIDDSSPDGTYDEVLKLSKKYKKLHAIKGKKEGLGRAYVNAFRYALKTYDPDIMLGMDADGQHPPSLLPSFFKEIDSGADLVIGSRYIKGGSIPSNWELYRKFFSYFGNNLVLRFGFMEFSVTDWTSGFRAYKASFIWDTLDHYEKLDGYTFQIGMVDKALKQHLNIKEIPLVFEERGEGESKIETFKFVIDNLMYIFFNSTFVKYAIVGFTAAAFDFGIAALLIGSAGLYKPHANAISAEVAIIINFMLNNFWAFKHKQIEGKATSYIAKFIKFNLVNSGSIVIQWVGMYIALNIIGDFAFNVLNIPIQTWIIYKAFIIGFIVIPYSYFMYNVFIWNEPSKKGTA